MGGSKQAYVKVLRDLSNVLPVLLSYIGKALGEHCGWVKTGERIVCPPQAFIQPVGKWRQDSGEQPVREKNG